MHAEYFAGIGKYDFVSALFLQQIIKEHLLSQVFALQ
jgi:hypothetical protein